MRIVLGRQEDGDAEVVEPSVAEEVVYGVAGEVGAVDGGGPPPHGHTHCDQHYSKPHGRPRSLLE